MIDKSWIEKSNKSREFSDGVVQFLDFAFSHASVNGKIICPCTSCKFRVRGNRADVFSHLLERGFPRRYTTWYMHGEKFDEPNEEPAAQTQAEPVRQYPGKELLNDAFGGFEDHGFQDPIPSSQLGDDGTRGVGAVNNEEYEKIEELLKDGNQELYDGCSKYNNQDKILEILPPDQECAASSGVPSMILAHPNDAIGKVFGVEHYGRVRGLGHGVCPTNIFDMPTHCNIRASSNNASQHRIEDLEKQVEILQDKLSGYDETKA